MPDLTPQDPDFEDRIRESFAQQGLKIEVPFADGLTQQDGFLHASVVLACTDSVCGRAAR